MAVRGTLISLNEIIQRAIGINDIEQMPGVQNLNRRSDPQEEAFLYGTLNHPSLSESSWSQIDRSPLHERRCRQQRRRRRRWKISNCFRCTSAVRDEAHNSQIASPSEKSPGLESNALLVTHLPLLFFDNGLDIPSSRDAPPTYSSIFADSLSNDFTFPINDGSFVVTRIPPPTYIQAQGIGLTEPSVDPFVSISPNAASNWPRVPAPAICSQCSALIITVVVVLAMLHDSVLHRFLQQYGPLLSYLPRVSRNLHTVKRVGNSKMTRDQSLIALLMCCIVFHIYVDAWNNRGRHKIADRRRLWQLNDNGSGLSGTAGMMKRKWELSKFPNNRTQITREKRLFSLFTLVKFDNGICGGLNGENGTCVAAAECAQRGGISSGVCANGYGVCCIVTVSCGGMITNNNTYFVNPNYPSTFDGMESCQVTLMKSNPDVCQYRLDFVQFNIRGPETVNNVCVYDQFIVSGGNPVPTICGNNDGNHMYIDTGVGQTNPVTLTFVTSGNSYSRSWKVRVSQIPCSTIYRAEEGCLQYFTGVSGQIKSFNYDPTTGLQLSNQDYSICIRMERNFCGIQYMACPDAQGMMPTLSIATGQIMRSSAFTLTGNTQATQIVSMTGTACMTDWLSIPCATNLGRLPSTPLTCIDRLCGGTFNSESQNLNESSVISTVKPFRLIFHTDSTEGPGDVGNRGFCLNYVQQPCTTKLK